MWTGISIFTLHFLSVWEGQIQIDILVDESQKTKVHFHASESVAYPIYCFTVSSSNATLVGLSQQTSDYPCHGEHWERVFHLIHQEEINNIGKFMQR